MSDLISKELLSLVLDIDVCTFNINNFGETSTFKSIFILNKDSTVRQIIPLDTLGRLIREYIAKEGYIYNLFNSTSIQGYVMIINDNKVIGKTEIELCVKSIEFIAKEKGSIWNAQT